MRIAVPQTLSLRREIQDNEKLPAQLDINLTLGMRARLFDQLDSDTNIEKRGQAQGRYGHENKISPLSSQ